MPIRDGRDPAQLALAAQQLADGQLVAFATETVYGLGGRADDDQAVARIFAAKGRPADHPLIVHVATLADAQAFGDLSHPAAQRLAQHFWPGALTLIVPRRPALGTAAAGGQSSIGLRMPSHPVALALLQAASALGVPGVAAPSANRFGRISPTRAEHVAAEFGTDLLVLDGGPCELGIESTIVDCSRGAAALLRPGQIDRVSIESVLGHALHEAGPDAPRASGTLAAHYAPRANLRLLDAGALRSALERLVANAETTPWESVPVQELFDLGWSTPSPDPVAAASRVYLALATLRRVGLAGHVERTAAGYRLMHSRELRVVDGAASEPPAAG